METFTKLCQQMSYDDIFEIRRELVSITDRIAPAYANLNGDNALTMLLSLHQITTDELWSRYLAKKANPEISSPSIKIAQEEAGAPGSTATTSSTKKGEACSDTTATTAPAHSPESESNQSN